MTALEEKLKRVVQIVDIGIFAKDAMIEGLIADQRVIPYKDALSIIRQEIDEACKKQREICADAFMTKEDYLYIKLNTRDTISTLKRDEILNAPSPKEK